MAKLATVPGYPYEIPDYLVCGDGVNLALWNELVDSIRFELDKGLILVELQSFFHRFATIGTMWPIVFGFSNVSATSTGGYFRTMIHGFELQPGWDKFDVLCMAMLPGVGVNLFGSGIGTARLGHIRFTVENVSRGTSAVVLHLFSDENSYNNHVISFGLAAHGTNPPLIQNISTLRTLVNYSVDIPGDVQVIGTSSDICQLKIELGLPPPIAGVTYQVGPGNFPTFTGLESMILTCKKDVPPDVTL